MTSDVIFPIPPGLFCVPSALVALTGADIESVINPALNRAARAETLTGAVGPAQLNHMLAALNELGYDCRRARDTHRHKVATWAQTTLSRAYPRPLLLRVRGHVLVAFRGRVYDSIMPHGPRGVDHPYAGTVVTDAFLIQSRKKSPNAHDWN